MKQTLYTIHTDGGARGNPGPAAVGVVIYDTQGKIVAERGKKIGDATNNVAEYSGVIEAYHMLKTLPKENASLQIIFVLDSLLVVNQLRGLFKIKDARLRELFMKIKILEQELGREVTYTHVPREQNKRADFLLNQALDAEEKI